MPLLTPTLTLCDKIVAELIAAWAPTGTDEVLRVYEVPIKLSELKGRKVYVFPDEYTAEPAERETDLYAHGVVVLTVERYPSATGGKPPVAWVDERVDFVWQRVWNGLDYSRDSRLLKFDGRSVWTESVGPAEVYDADRLQGLGVFWSEVPFTFHEYLG